MIQILAADFCFFIKFISYKYIIMPYHEASRQDPSKISKIQAFLGYGYVLE